MSLCVLIYHDQLKFQAASPHVESGKLEIGPL